MATVLGSEGEVADMLDKKCVTVLHFTASFSKHCETVSAALGALATQHGALRVYQVDAEKVPKSSEKYGIEAVPTCVIFSNGKVQETVAGLNMPRVAKAVTQAISNNKEEQEEVVSLKPLKERLKDLTTMGHCVAFIKGSPEAPRCKFTRALMEMFTKHNVQFSYFDILADPEVREGLKEYANWPTYPQVWMEGELLGGLDIMKELEENNELTTSLPCKLPLNARLKNIINSSPVMLFMKGDPGAPRCGFSKTTIGILTEYTDVKYSTFDILTDNEVRQGLKEYSNWPTYPQLYVKGELIGGLDIIREMHESGELFEELKG